jgi:flagellar hook-basal body complex protein FliE
MNTIDPSRLLLQMRSLAAEAAREPALLQQTPAATTADFGELLKSSIARVSDMQQGATSLSTAFEQGVPGVDLTQVMLEVQKASLSFRAMTEVRNRLVNAYQEVMSMPI